MCSTLSRCRRDMPSGQRPASRSPPHLSGDVPGWLDTLANQFKENAERFVEGRPLLNVVDKGLGFVPSDTGPIVRSAHTHGTDRAGQPAL